MSAKERIITDKARRLYQMFPGAAQPPQSTHIDGQLRTLWGEVDYTPEFKFCEAIARELTDSVLAAMVTTKAEAVEEALREMAAALNGEEQEDDQDTVRPN